MIEQCKSKGNSAHKNTEKINFS